MLPALPLSCHSPEARTYNRSILGEKCMTYPNRMVSDKQPTSPQRHFPIATQQRTEPDTEQTSMPLSPAPRLDNLSIARHSHNPNRNSQSGFIHRHQGRSNVMQAPAFCRLVGVTTPAVNFEVWLPLSGWNGNYQSVGNGGMAGTISYASMANALRRGLCNSKHRYRP